MRLLTAFASAVALLGVSALAAPAACAPELAKKEDLLLPRSATAAELGAPLTPRADSPTLNDAINNIHHPESDYFHRDEWLKRIVAGLRDKWPTHNVFAFHRFHDDFKWGVSDPKSMEAEAAFNELNGKTEYFQVVVFKSDGVLERTGGDGGWANWGFSGWYDRDGDKVLFKNPPS